MRKEIPRSEWLCLCPQAPSKRKRAPGREMCCVNAFCEVFLRFLNAKTTLVLTGGLHVHCSVAPTIGLTLNSVEAGSNYNRNPAQ
jgi:hypothetical protein